MPSFDLVSSLDIGEMKNTIQMTQKQINGRYDFKGSECILDFNGDNQIEIKGDSEYQVKTMLSLLYENMGKRGLGLKCVDAKDVLPSGNQKYKQSILLNSGIDKEKAKVINKVIKKSGLKVSSQYMDEKIRVTGKKIDDLQSIFKILKSDKTVEIDLRMENMK
ncbi:MAG: YajQ family cyclic di-GMP-binding protein [Halobacteriovoraceae bacterium]|nr:YajQ family cyclic di-GMP-binding protein [Halobacteriovoraceae bacterium]